MKKSRFLSLFFGLTVLAAAGLLSGCDLFTVPTFDLDQVNKNRQNQTADSAADTAGGNAADSTAGNAAGNAGADKIASGQTGAAGQTAKPTFQKYYPDQGVAENINTVSNVAGNDAPESASFTITPELTVQMYLVDKYQPGICYGLPGPVPEAAITGMIERNPGLAAFVRSHYHLPSDLEVYNKIKQLNGVDLIKLASGQYTYSFVDGQCCLLTAYEGEVTVLGAQITDQIKQQQTQNNPC